MWSDTGSLPPRIAGFSRAPAGAPSAGRFRPVAIVAGLVLALSACSTVDSMFGAGDPPPTSRTSSGGAAPAATGTENKDFPRLSTVPPRPERPVPPPQQGLVPDRAGARYADGQVRPVNETAGAVVGQRLGPSTRPAASQPGVEPAATSPAPQRQLEQPSGPMPAVPPTPVESAPTTPVQTLEKSEAPLPGKSEGDLAAATAVAADGRAEIYLAF